MYQIEEISWLWLGIIPILVVILFAIDRIWKSKIQNRFASNEVISMCSIGELRKSFLLLCPKFFLSDI